MIKGLKAWKLEGQEAGMPESQRLRNWEVVKLGN
jgi:hypothetical protein